PKFYWRNMLTGMRTRSTSLLNFSNAIGPRLARQCSRIGKRDSQAGGSARSATDFARLERARRPPQHQRDAIALGVNRGDSPSERAHPRTGQASQASSRDGSHSRGPYFHSVEPEEGGHFAQNRLSGAAL